jgi:hypothetical protein
MTHAAHPSRRRLLGGAAQAAIGLAALKSTAFAATGRRAGGFPGKAEPFPMEAVRLKPSVFLTAVEANQGYLKSVEPDRLLHNFRKGAGLTPKGEAYGGWEADTIAGHSLGHYLSAVSLMYGQTGEPLFKERSDYIVAELAACQKAQGDGYVAGFTRKRGDILEDGKVLFSEWERGDIKVAPFYTNGCWVPLYNFHKTFTGLFDAHRYCANEQALAVAKGLAGYIDGVFARLSDEQVQKILDCEHGGINESMAELHARTGDPRWLALAERIRHRKVLDPLSRGEDDLDYIHANTQIPKIIGLARLYELTGKPGHRTAASFFWTDVTGQRSYVIGGNADREYFQRAGAISKYITEQTCESCNSYNMLKLTRHLYQWAPDAAYFDYYERAHFNHILAQHNPKTGMFSYMVPLMSGSKRDFSTPFDDFWCCVGTGMESHSKHGDSIYWRGQDHLLVNLFIPSTLSWKEKGARFELETGYPFAERVAFKVTEARGTPFKIGMRIPSWCAAPSLSVNGAPHLIKAEHGYAVVGRAWKAGDRIELTLPMQVRVESTPDDPDTIALMHGPLVLAADMGPADKPFSGIEPALVSADVPSGFKAGAQPAVFRTEGIGRPGDLDFAPFFQQYERRTAVYFRRFTEPQWTAEQGRLAAEKARLVALDARSVDKINLGDGADEKAHGLESKLSYTGDYRRRGSRDARVEGFFQFRMKSGPGPLVLQATYWGDERNRLFNILVDGKVVATQKLQGEQPGAFMERDYPIPVALTQGKDSVLVRFEPVGDHSAGPVFACRLFKAETTAA